MKINKNQLPIKAHFFFFMAAMGPILPFLAVIGKQLGISPLVFGCITSVLPIAFLIAKPAFGFLVDRYYEWRKSIFIILLASTTVCFILMYFLPHLPGPNGKVHPNVTCGDFRNCYLSAEDNENVRSNKNVISPNCFWNCDNNKLKMIRVSDIFEPNTCDSVDNACLEKQNESEFICRGDLQTLICKSFINASHLYTSIKFWGFVILMALGTIGFNVSNCISDAVCFDVLGENGQMGYGRQRVWGTIGFGISALLAGFAMDEWSHGQEYKNYTPAFVIAFSFSVIDLLCCTKLTLPRMSSTESIITDVYKLIRMKPVAIFLVFAVIAGMIDSFVIYYLFWYMEDLATETGYMDSIKLIEGLTVAAETLVGEVIFFSLAGKILKAIGFGYTLTLCFLCYAIRLALMSLAKTPWWIVLIELFMQGPTYALCYTTIVAYASKISPPGASATVQGIVAGMDDGLGFAFGSLIGGILYKHFGGVVTLRLYSVIAFITSVIYLLFYTMYLKESMPETDTRKNIEFKSPEEAQKECVNNAA